MSKLIAIFLLITISLYLLPVKSAFLKAESSIFKKSDKEMKEDSEAKEKSTEESTNNIDSELVIHSLITANFSEAQEIRYTGYLFSILHFPCFIEAPPPDC